MKLSTLISSDTIEPTVIAYLMAREISWLRYEVEQIGKIISATYSDQSYDRLSSIADDLLEFISMDADKHLEKATLKLLKAYKKSSPNLNDCYEELSLAPEVYAEVHLQFLKEFVPDAVTYLDAEGNPRPSLMKEFKKRFDVEKELDLSQAKNLLLNQQELAFNQHSEEHPFSFREFFSSLLHEQPLLNNVIFVHPDVSNPFSDEREPCSALQVPQSALFWYLFPVGRGKNITNWFIVNGNVGYTWLLDYPDSASDIEDAIISILREHLPKALDNLEVDIRLDPDDIVWGVAAEYPKHVAQRLDEVGHLMSKNPKVERARPSISAMNRKKISIAGETFTPVEGLTNVLAEHVVTYLEEFDNMGPIQRFCRKLTRKSQRSSKV
jgi:hypothetical protein